MLHSNILHSSLISIQFAAFFFSLSNSNQISDTLRKAYMSCSCPIAGFWHCKGKDYDRKLALLLLRTSGIVFFKDLCAAFPILVFIVLEMWCKRNRKDFRGKINVLSITSMMNCILETIYLIDQLACTVPCGSAALLLNMLFSLKS